MRQLGLHEIRKEFLDFFEKQDHYRAPSYSLIPENDPSLLLIGAGMAPLKKFFTGEKTPPAKRMTTCQKCLRTGDIDNVGVTDRHATFFEMLGNFSFGDYFKEEAIRWAWEFLTEVLEISKEDLWVTVFEKDDEAYGIWHETMGLPEERIVRLGKEDNFWELEVGPSGPCSEIYVDRGEAYGCGKEDCKPGCECDRFIEIWNLVFTQFDKDAEGNYHPLSHPNIDTGMGLERIATVLQGRNNIFEIDALKEIIEKVEELAKYEYGKDKKLDMSVRVIADHIRAITFLISDGVIPSNEGRGYVLRRLLRRAATHGRKLGLKEPFLTEVSSLVIDSWSVNYPELKERQDMILEVIQREEEKFLETLETGLNFLREDIASLKKRGMDKLSGIRAFKLYDTYGFPVDLTQEILGEGGLKVDLAAFKEEMNKQKERARAARDDSNMGWEQGENGLNLDFTVEFTGYEKTEDQGKVLGLFKDQGPVEKLSPGDQGIVITDKTPFYGEGGGQVGDTGLIFRDSFKGDVLDTQKTKSGTSYSLVKVLEGDLKLGDQVDLKVDEDRRKAIARNHSVTHLLHKALKDVLGDHVNQAGSEVRDTWMRFDFSHHKAMTPEEIRRVEDLVNEKILEDLPVTKENKPLDQAKAEGAIGLFEGKYKDQVRVVTMGDYSKELCGGIHVDRTGEIGLFKILSENGIAAGVRRIEATTGLNLLDRLRAYEDQDQSLADYLKASKGDILTKVSQLLSREKKLKKDLDQLKKDLASSDLDSQLSEVKEKNGISYITGILKDVDPDNLRTLAEETRDKHPSILVALASINGDKVQFACAVSKDLTKKVQAGKVIGQVAKIAGGGGGGRPDFAQAGGKKPEKVEEAMAHVSDFF